MTITAATNLSIPAARPPAHVVVGVHGSLDVSAVARLQPVLDDIAEDADNASACADLHDIRGVDVAGVSSLAGAGL